jgi:microcin C transport system permease protein
VLSPVARRTLSRFRANRRAYWSFWILVVSFVISLFSEHVANDHPLILRYEGRTYFPTLKFYPGEEFGGRYKTEANYRALRTDPDFAAKGGWMLLPPIPHSPLHPYLDNEGAPPHKPSRKHWLGTDNAARDVLARLLYGYRSCMLFALALTAIGTVLGILVGGLQGYAGGKTDLLLQRLIEIWSALPFLYVVILVGSIYGQSFGVLLFVMSLFQWVGLSYYMRGEFLKLRDQPYVLASRSLGAGNARLIFRQILPNAMTPVITLLPFSIVGGISSLTALDFLGFGLPPPSPSWGEMIRQGLDNLHAPWIALSAVSALFLTLLLASFVGEGVRDAFDPKSLTKIQ